MKAKPMHQEKDPSPNLSIVVPCYNEEEILPSFINRALETCAELDITHEIIFIDDGSKDRTWALIQSAHQTNEHIKGIKLSRNHGHQLALTAGLMAARGERTLIIDADLQDPPELLGAMWSEMDKGADVVYGVRRKREGETRFKLGTAYLFYRLLSVLSDVPIPADTGDFRLIARQPLDVLLSMPEQHRFIRGMVSWLGFKQVPLPYDRHRREAGVSKYPFLKMWKFALNAITSFSVKPLKIASFLGFSMGGIALAGILYIITGYIFGHTVEGWTSLIVVILLIGSLQLIVLGIIGEYLGRLFLESKRRPLFIVSETTN